MSVSIDFAQRNRDIACQIAALTMRADIEYGGTWRDGFMDEFADAWLRDYDHMPSWLATADDGNPVGFVQTSLIAKLPSLCRPTTNWMHVKNVFVAPQARGAGLAGRMMEQMIAWGDQHQVERYQLNAEPKARTLYQRLGFGPPNERLMVRRGTAPERQHG